MVDVPATTVTPEILSERINAKDAEAERLLDEAKILLGDVLSRAWRDVPVYVVNLLIVRVARALKDSERTSNGGGQVTATDAMPVRASTDPLASSYAVIRRYVVLGL